MNISLEARTHFIFQDPRFCGRITGNSLRDIHFPIRYSITVLNSTDQYCEHASVPEHLISL